MIPDLPETIEAYLRQNLEIDDLSVTAADQMSRAGLSRTVLRVETTQQKGVSKSYIFLLEDANSPVPPNRVAEYLAMRQLSEHSDIKVPRAYCVENSKVPLGSAFVVTELLPGSSQPRLLMQPEYEPKARGIARQSFEILGRLAAIDADSIDLGASIVTPARQDVHAVELERHERILRESEVIDRPIISAALRHLHRNIPVAPDKIAVVHGDYRIGNYLFDETGVTGVIDWEMVHKGDPLEDLAWASLPNWQFAARPGLTAGFLTRAEVIAAWEETSGLKVDRDALDWWILLCQLKATCIRAMSRHMFKTGKTNEFFMAWVGYGLPIEESHIAHLFERQRT